MKNLDFDEDKLTILDDIYDFGGEQVIEVIKSLDDAIENVILFGHNHAFTSISNIFGNRYIDNLPTSGLVQLEFDINSWAELKHGKTKLILIPRELR